MRRRARGGRQATVTLSRAAGALRLTQVSRIGMVMSDNAGGRAFFPSALEQATRSSLRELYEASPIPSQDRLEHLEVYMRPQRISEILSLGHLYRRILRSHGVIMEFGVRWGRHLSVFIALRTRYEPHNLYRKVLGFDTFEGFADPSLKDGTSPRVHRGAMAVSERYEAHLEQVLALHEQETPGSHIRRFDLVKGDAPEALERYFKQHPETIVALAYFDMDVYRPTKACLDLLGSHMTKGGIIAFDQISHPDFPGEAIALKESAWFGRAALERLPYAPYPTFISV